MIEEKNQAIEIRTDPNPWMYGPPLFLAIVAVSTQPNILGLGTALSVLLALAVWWLARPQSIIISFDTKEGTFVYSSLNPFRQRKVVSLAKFSRVYASPFYRHGGWSIHLSGPRGEHLLLARIPSPWAPTFRVDDRRSICTKIASVLHIA